MASLSQFCIVIEPGNDRDRFFADQIVFFVYNRTEIFSIAYFFCLFENLWSIGKKEIYLFRFEVIPGNVIQ